MPTYEYKYDACGFEFEKFQSIKAAAVKKCPHCGKRRARRLMGTGVGLIFKGGGFYTTDYRSEAYKSAAKADTGEKPAATAAKAGGAESSSKPAAESKPPTESKPRTESKRVTESKPDANSAAPPAKTGKSPK
ncbi:MAG: zinc ribbon domain-containing protein [Tepidisphaeraceae bacterium]